MHFQTVKFLRITLDSKLTWEEAHVPEVSTKLLKTIYEIWFVMLRRKIHYSEVF
jgi:hypothetical protein